MKKNTKKKGFTLVELIVVIAILGILAAVAVPSLSGFQEKARLNAHMANINTIESAIGVYEAENGTGTATTALLATIVPNWPTTPGTYSVAGGILTASPTKTATQAALDGGTAVTWPAKP